MSAADAVFTVMELEGEFFRPMMPYPQRMPRADAIRLMMRKNDQYRSVGREFVVVGVVVRDVHITGRQIAHIEHPPAKKQPKPRTANVVQLPKKERTKP